MTDEQKVFLFRMVLNGKAYVQAEYPSDIKIARQLKSRGLIQELSHPRHGEGYGFTIKGYDFTEKMLRELLAGGLKPARV